MMFMTQRERIIDKANALIFVYENAIADGYVHIRVSDGKHLETVDEILRALRNEKKIQIIPPWHVEKLVRKVRF